MPDRRLAWVGSSLAALREFPEAARRAAGYQLRRLQQGFMPSATRIEASSGNVFSDLGFNEDEAQHLKIRADLMIELSCLIDEKGLTQTEAAKLLGVSQPRISDLVRGKIDRFSVDGLIQMLGQAGARVSFEVKIDQQVA